MTPTQQWLDGLVHASYSGFMKIASITEAKNGLSGLIDGLKSGSPVLIMDRGRPVASLEPVSVGSAGDAGRIARLARAGTLKPRRTNLDKSLFKVRLPRPKKGASAVAALIRERREDR